MPIENVHHLDSFPVVGHATYSDVCPTCQRSISLGTDPHEARCHCGQAYRVTFTRSVRNETIRRGTFCMDLTAARMQKASCGERVPEEKLEERPQKFRWIKVNEYQHQCSGCQAA
jgi:hypothetical protein